MLVLRSNPSVPTQLGYQNPRDMPPAGRPESGLARAACAIVLFSVGASAVTLLFAASGLSAEVPGVIALLSLALCLIGGVPIAIGALADRGFGKRLAWVALAGNLLWPVLVLLMAVVVIFVRGAGR